MGGASSIPEVNDEELDQNKIKMLETRCKLLEEQIAHHIEPDAPASSKKLEKETSLDSVLTRNDNGVIETYTLRLINVQENSGHRKFELPRGAYYVQTKFGPVQFGIPPETIKCSMSLGLKVPTYFVVPPERFDTRLGINLAEVEFPAYFNFFLLQSKVHIVLTSMQRKAIQESFIETIEGPKESNIFLEDDYGKFRTEKSWLARPDLTKEINYFREPRNGREINCDTLIEFHEFNSENTAVLSFNEGHIRIVNNIEKSRFDVFEGDEAEILEFVSYAEANAVPTPEEFEKLHNKYRRAGSVDDNDSFIEIEGKKIDSNSSYTIEGSVQFNPLDFGVTMLGTSHGFDGKGVTTGFILWVAGMGIYVDPPPHADSYLISHRVSPRKVQKIILTHCHADHDAGTFQKLIKEKKISLVTTKTIYHEFIRKYGLISGIKEEILFSVIDFEEININFPHNIYGASLRFFYSLHALPCIGFQVSYGGKSIAYSGDTFYEKEGLETLVAKGVISKERKNSLMNFPWDADVILHECGIPPIHTPVSALKKLPKDVQERLYAVHISDTAAKDAGLKKAPLGFSNSINLEVRSKPHRDAIHVLRAFSKSGFFEEVNLETCALLLEVGLIKRFAKNVSFNGEFHGIFFLVLEGTLLLNRAKKSQQYLRVGDYFGELSCYEGNTEKIGLQAITAVRVFQLDTYGLMQLLKGCPALKNQLDTLSELRGSGFGSLILLNRYLKRLSSQQLVNLRFTIATTICMQSGEELDITQGIIVKCGRGQMLGESVKSNFPTKRNNKERYLKRATFYIPSNILKNISFIKSNETSPLPCRLRCSEKLEIHVLDTKALQRFLNANPSIQLALFKEGGCLS